MALYDFIPVQKARVVLVLLPSHSLVLADRMSI